MWFPRPYGKCLFFFFFCLSLQSILLLLFLSIPPPNCALARLAAFGFLNVPYSCCSTCLWHTSSNCLNFLLQRNIKNLVVNNSGCCSVIQSCPTLQLSGLQHARLPSPSQSSGVHSNSLSPLSWWCHPTISSSAISFSSCLQSSQHQGLFQWVGSLHQVAKVLEFQLQHQSFQWIFRVDFL